MSQAIDLTAIPIHLGREPTATPVEGFGWSTEELDAYEGRFASDGNAGRLVMVFDNSADWPTWERHPAGEEVVVLLTGRADLVQWVDGAEQVIPMAPGQAVVNPTGVWHTARVHEPGQALFITPGAGTENVALADFPPA